MFFQTIKTWLIGKSVNDLATMTTCYHYSIKWPFGLYYNHPVSPITKQRYVVISQLCIYTVCCQMLMLHRGHLGTLWVCIEAFDGQKYSKLHTEWMVERCWSKTSRTIIISHKTGIRSYDESFWARTTAAISQVGAYF